MFLSDRASSASPCSSLPNFEPSTCPALPFVAVSGSVVPAEVDEEVEAAVQGCLG